MMGDKDAGFNFMAGPDGHDEAAAEMQRRVGEAAARALAEAKARRKPMPPDSPRESGGREGPDPVRYGDWETKGRASDF